MKDNNTITRYFMFLSTAMCILVIITEPQAWPAASIMFALCLVTVRMFGGKW